eukprot:9757350-Prorocentrum_lima.AAC.1
MAQLRRKDPTLSTVLPPIWRKREPPSMLSISSAKCSKNLSRNVVPSDVTTGCAAGRKQAPQA